MSGNEIKSTELARELNLKASDVVKLLGRIKDTEFKKGTTNVRITAEEADKIRELAGAKKVQEARERPSAEAPPQKKPEPGAPKAELVKKKVHKAYEPAKADSARRTEAKKDVPAEVEAEEAGLGAAAPPVVSEEDEEVKVPDRFKKEIEVEKVEKIKVKPTMQKAFQAIKKIEPKKWVDQKSMKRPKDRMRRPEAEQQPQITAPRKKSIKFEEGTTVKAFAELIGLKIPDVIKKLMELGYMATVNQPIDYDAALLVADSFGIRD